MHKFYLFIVMFVLIALPLQAQVLGACGSGDETT